MSAEAVRAVASLTAPTTQAERVLLAVLAQEADASGIVASPRASQVWIASQCGWSSVERVRQVSVRLRARGLLEVLAAGRPGVPTVFRLPFVRALDEG